MKRERREVTPRSGRFPFCLLLGYLAVPQFRANCENALFKFIDSPNMKSDCAFFSNQLDKETQESLKLSLGYSKINSFYKPLFMEFNRSVTATLTALDHFPDDCVRRNGIIKARKQFLLGLNYATEKLEVKIALLAASTKRLFGKEIELRVNSEGQLDKSGFTLRERYPEIIFTNGDNGTASVLNMEIDSLLLKSEIVSGKNTIIINGLGLLGLDSLEYLSEKNLDNSQIIIISNHTKDLKQYAGYNQIRINSNISDIDKNEIHKIRSIINCTHNPEQIVTAEKINHIQNGQSINVIDVAVPYGFPKTEFDKCNNVFRQDGGNAYFGDSLEFFFNPKMCGLTENVLYGCFAETIALSTYLKEHPAELEEVKKMDFFNVNRTTKQFIKKLFDKYKIGIAPTPYNFMEKL